MLKCLQLLIGQASLDIIPVSEVTCNQRMVSLTLLRLWKNVFKFFNADKPLVTLPFKDLKCSFQLRLLSTITASDLVFLI